MAKSMILYYLFYLCKFFAIGFLFYRLGRKFRVRDPYWHYLVPVWNYLILCRCTRTSPKYAISYNVVYFIAALVQTYSEAYQEAGLINIWLGMFMLCILLEAEIFGKLAERLGKDYWFYGFSGFAAYFPLIFLILSKREPECEPPMDVTGSSGSSVY